MKIDDIIMATTADITVKHTIVALFYHQVKQNPAAIAFICGNNKITFAQLDKQSDVLAERLRIAGITPQQMIPVFIQNSIELMVSILAIFKAGAVYVPMDPGHPSQRITFMLTDLKATCVLVKTADDHSVFQQKEITLITVDATNNVAETPVAPTSSYATIMPNTAYIIYTSGSTGNPKGVMVTHGALVNYLVNAQTAYISASENRAGSFIHLSATFDASLTALFMPMIAGKFSVIATKQKAEVFTDENLWKYAPYDFLKITPAHLDFLAPTFKSNGKWLTQKIVIGGEALYPSQLEIFSGQNLTLKIVNEYGPTETTVGCTVFSFFITELADFTSEIPIGKPIDHTAIYVFEEKDGALTPAIKGEMYIGGDSLAMGYLNNEQMTASKFIKNPLPESPHARIYKTGDLARWLPNGNLAYIGRIDDQVKISDHRVELGEIESAINQLEEVATSCVLFKKNKEDDIGRLIAYVVPAQQAPVVKQPALNIRQVAEQPSFFDVANDKTNEQKMQVDTDNMVQQQASSNTTHQTTFYKNPADDNNVKEFEQRIKAVLAKQLPAYMVPDHVVAKPQLPLTSNGKIDRIFLSTLNIQANTTAEELIKPTNAIEEKLVKIWEGLFMVNNISTTADFFAIGGTSIQAARMFALINKQLIAKLPLTTLIKAPTIKQLAAIINGGNLTNRFSPIFAFNQHGSSTPLFLLHAGGGDILFYKDLANHLGSHQQVYGVIARGLDGKQLPLTSIKAMGHYYANEILKVQPRGPFRIAGYCLGAIISFEIANILTQKGHIVEFLASINGVSPTYSHQPPRQITTGQPVTHVKNIKGKIGYHYQKLAGLSLVQMVKYPFKRVILKLVLGYLNTAYKARLKLYGFYLARNKALPLVLARNYYFDTNTEMAANYQPAEYSGSMTVFRAPHLYPEKTLGWKNHVVSTITTIDIPGYHKNRRVILYEPHVTLLAQKMSEALAAIPTTTMVEV